MDNKEIDLDFEYLGGLYQMTYYTQRKDDGKKKDVLHYYVSFEDNGSGYYMQDELIFKFNPKDNSIIFPMINKGTIGLSFSIADAILGMEYIDEMPELPE